MARLEDLTQDDVPPGGAIASDRVPRNGLGLIDAPRAELDLREDRQGIALRRRALETAKDSRACLVHPTERHEAQREEPERHLLLRGNPQLHGPVACPNRLLRATVDEKRAAQVRVRPSLGG